MIAGFDEPTEGEIEIDGRSAVGIPPNKRNVNTVFQAYALFPHMTVLDNVAYGLKQRKVGKEDRYRQAGEALELVRLTGREQAKPAQLSGGMQQRVALARALVMNPKVLLLDEPLGALDLKLRKAMQVELKRIQRDVGITFIVVTHDQEEAMAMADRIAVMNAGRIDQLAAPSEIYDRPATPFVADFIGDMNHLEGTLERDGDNLVGERRRRPLRDRPRRRARREVGERVRLGAAARGGARQHARRGRAGDVPDGDGARPPPADRRACWRPARSSSRSSAAPATSGSSEHRPGRQAVARLEPDRGAAARPRRTARRDDAAAEPARSCRPDLRKEATRCPTDPTS